MVNQILNRLSAKSPEYSNRIAELEIANDILNAERANLITELADQSAHNSALQAELDELRTANNAPTKSEGDEHLKEFAAESCKRLEGISQQITIAIDEAEQAIATAIEAFTEASGSARELTLIATQALNPTGAEGAGRSLNAATGSMHDFINYILSIAKEIADSTEQAQSLFNTTQKLNGLLDQIERISKQTSLVSLNASIEAAHAGKASHGFAAVAEEVRKLAGRSAEAADQMRLLTQGLNAETGLICQKLGASASKSCDKAIHAQGVVINLAAIMREAKEHTDHLILDISGRSEAIQLNLDKVVTAFQFQDLLRQRLEHVATPILAVCNGLHVVTGMDSGSPTCDGGTTFIPSLKVVDYANVDDNVELFA